VGYLRVCFAPTFGVGDVLVLDDSFVYTLELVLEVLEELKIEVLFCLFICLVLILWSLCGVCGGCFA